MVHNRKKYQMPNDTILIFLRKYDIILVKGAGKCCGLSWCWQAESGWISLATSVQQHPPRYWSPKIMHSHVTWVMALDSVVSQWPAPSPDRYLNIDAPSAGRHTGALSSLRCCYMILYIQHNTGRQISLTSTHRPTKCPHCWSPSRCVRGRARAAVSGEDARVRLPISSLHPGVWPLPPPRRGWALCRPTSARTRRGETWRPLRSEAGKWRILGRPSLQVYFATQLFNPQIFPVVVSYCFLHSAA